MEKLLGISDSVSHERHAMVEFPDCGMMVQSENQLKGFTKADPKIKLCSLGPISSWARDRAPSHFQSGGAFCLSVANRTVGSAFSQKSAVAVQALLISSRAETHFQHRHARPGTRND